MTPFALDHPAVRDYLQRLDAATAHLPADERVEISEGIRSHLIAALAEAHTEADVRTTLDALGDPAEIVGAPDTAVSAAQPAACPPAAGRSARGVLEVVAVIFLLLGALIVPVVGWFVGVILLWVSKAWTTREKLIGTFVAPGGIAVFPFLALFVPFAAPSCTASVGTAVEVTAGGGRLTSAPVENVVETCSTGLPEVVTIAILAFFVIGPVVTAIYLLRAAGRRPAPA